MDLFSLSLYTKLILGSIAALAGIISGIFANDLYISFIHMINKRGPKPKQRSKKTWFIFIFSSLIFVLLGTYVAIAKTKEDENSIKTSIVVPNEITENVKIVPSEIRVDKNGFEVVDQFGDILWKKTISGVIKKAIIDDLNHDNELEIIVGITEDESNLRNPGDDVGKIIVYDSTGKLLWDASLANFAPYASNNGARSGVIVIEDILITDIGVENERSIIVLSRDLLWYPSKLTIISSNGNIGREYWHPGFIYQVLTATSKNSGKTYLIARADNNDLTAAFGLPYNTNPGTVFVLDSEKISGQAPPYYLMNIEQSTHVWYGYIAPIAKVKDIQVREIYQGNDVVVIQTENCYLYVDLESGNVNSVAVGIDDTQICNVSLNLLN